LRLGLALIGKQSLLRGDHIEIGHQSACVTIQRDIRARCESATAASCVLAAAANRSLISLPSSLWAVGATLA
jgi:hypothetical protein